MTVFIIAVAGSVLLHANGTQVICSVLISVVFWIGFCGLGSLVLVCWYYFWHLIILS